MAGEWVMEKIKIGNACDPDCLDTRFCPVGTSLEDGGLLLSKRRKDTPRLQENLEVMKHTDISVIRKAIAKQTLPVFVKTQRNHLHFVAGFMGLEALGLAPCKGCRILLYVTLKTGKQSRFVAAATCLDSLSLSTPVAGKLPNCHPWVPGDLRDLASAPWVPDSTIPAPSAVTPWNCPVHQEVGF